MPLWLFPSMLQSLAAALPFQGTYFLPISIYIGRLSGADAVYAIEFQFLWLVALVVLSRLLWGWAHRRLVVQGG